jgi:hypothetical protein
MQNIYNHIKNNSKFVIITSDIAKDFIVVSYKNFVITIIKNKYFYKTQIGLVGCMHLGSYEFNEKYTLETLIYLENEINMISEENHKNISNAINPLNTFLKSLNKFYFTPKENKVVEFVN